MKTFSARIGLFATLLLALASRAGWAQGSACLTNADTAAVHVALVTEVVTLGDSARTVSQGLPYRPPEGVTLVTDPTLCATMVGAYNSGYAPADSSKRLGRAYVLRVGTAVFAVVGDGRSVYSFFDASGRWLAAILH
jgi:hypothetical protein